MSKDKNISARKLNDEKVKPISISKSLNSRLIKEGYQISNEKHALKNDSNKPHISQKEQLLKLVNSAHLFHDEENTAYALIEKDDHREVWPVESYNFESYLTVKYLDKTGNSPSKHNLNEVISTLRAKALHQGECRSVARRVAFQDGHIILDLCDDQWRVIDIGPNGWTVKTRSPVPFVRSTGMKPLSIPIKGGSISELRPFINVKSESDFRLAVAWLLATFRPGYPFPLLILQGEQGSGKSTTARVLRSLIDPSQEESTSAPKNERDLMINASNGWVASFDNLSGIHDWFSDALCRVSTGGGYKTRKLYTDREEIVLKAQRPIMLNGIDEIATRGDLLDRAIVLEFISFSGSDKNIKTEQTFWTEFNEAKPSILGALLDVVSSALTRIDHIDPNVNHRMSDFVHWILAAEQALGWPEGQFLTDYKDNKSEAVTASLSDDSLAQGVMRLARIRGIWEGSAAELRDAIRGHLSGAERQSLPRSPSWIGRGLNRLKPSLRESGVYIERKRSSSGNVWIIRNMLESSDSIASNDGSTDN